MSQSRRSGGHSGRCGGAMRTGTGTGAGTARPTGSVTSSTSTSSSAGANGAGGHCGTGTGCGAGTGAERGAGGASGFDDAVPGFSAGAGAVPGFSRSAPRPAGRSRLGRRRVGLGHRRRAAFAGWTGCGALGISRCDSLSSQSLYAGTIFAAAAGAPPAANGLSASDASRGRLVPVVGLLREERVHHRLKPGRNVASIERGERHRLLGRVLEHLRHDVRFGERRAPREAVVQHAPDAVHVRPDVGDPRVLRLLRGEVVRRAEHRPFLRQLRLDLPFRRVVVEQLAAQPDVENLDRRVPGGVRLPLGRLGVSIRFAGFMSR